MRARIIFAAIFLIFLAACRPEPAPPAPTDPPPIEPTPTVSPIGRPFKGSHPAVYRLMENGRLRHITDWATYLGLGYQPDDLTQVSDDELAQLPLDLPLTRWLATQSDPTLYYLEGGRRYRVPNVGTVVVRGGSLPDVSLVTDDFLNRFQLAADPLPAATISDDDRATPRPTAALWANGYLWIANETGLLTRWDVQAGDYREIWLPDKSITYALAGAGESIYAGTDGGNIWQIAGQSLTTKITGNNAGRVSALTIDTEQQLWYADINYFDVAASRYHIGRGLIRHGQKESVFHFIDEDAAHDPLKSITALAFHPKQPMLWAATRFAGLLQYNLTTEAWQQFTAFNSALADNAIADLAFAADGTLWLAAPAGVSSYKNGIWENHTLAEGLTEKGALSLAVAADGTVWVAGDNYIAQKEGDDSWQVYTALDHPLLADSFGLVVLDDNDNPWLIGRRQKLHFDGQNWTAYANDVRRSTPFIPQQPPADVTPPPLDFPSPLEDYTAWLQHWPRPENDNGRGMHFLQNHWFDEFETQKQVNRMQRLGVRWTMVNYANRYQMLRSEPIFRQAGMMVVWRPFVRPYEQYDSWAEDIEFLRSRGVPPYIQLYNEPSLAQEWDNDYPIDQDLFLDNLIPAIREVYDAGGYVGLQFLNPDWLRATLQRMKAEDMADVFDRLFFVPHPYGLNHPPDYDEDINSALGFREFAAVFEEEIGFIPMMMAGEGGWRPGEQQDNRYPIVDETLHRDYHVAVFEWFRTGQLSNGEPLPDYLFAFSPWLIADPNDPAAWFDSASGNRTLTIEAVEARPPFQREFSWNR